MNDEFDEKEIRNLMKKCFDDEQEEEVEEESEDVYREVEQLKCQLELSRKKNEHLQRNYRTMIEYCEDLLNNDRFQVEQLQIRSSREDLTKIDVVEPVKISTNDRFDELLKENATLKRKIDELENQTRRSGSSSSSGSGETVIATNSYLEQIRKLTKTLDDAKRDYADLEEKYEYEKHELQAMIDQLREDMITAEANRAFAINDSSSAEEALRTQFEFDLKRKLDDVHRVLDEDYRTKLKTLQDELAQVKNQEKRKSDDSRRVLDEENRTKLKSLQDELAQMKKDEKRKLDELRRVLEDDYRTKLKTLQDELAQVKKDEKRKLDEHRRVLEEENRTKLKSLQDELAQVKKDEKRKLDEDHRTKLKTLQDELAQVKKDEKRKLEELRRVLEDDYRTKLTNLHDEFVQVKKDEKRKLDEDHRMKLKSLQDELTQIKNEKKNEENLQTRFIVAEKELENLKEDYKNLHEKKKELFNNCSRLENENEGLQRSLNQLQDKYRQMTDRNSQNEEKLLREIRQLNQLNELQKEEIRSIHRDSIDQNEKSTLEAKIREYEQTFEQYEDFRKKIEENLDKIVEQRNHYKSAWKKLQNETTKSNSFEIERIENEKTNEMYRKEIERLNHENAELVQYQSKLIGEHERQMEKLNNDLDHGYSNVIDEFRQEQNHFQKRVDLLKEDLNKAQRTIDHLKNQFDNLKQNNTNDLQFREIHERLLAERTVFLRKETEYQEKISTLQLKVAEMLKKPIEQRVHRLRDSNNVRPRSFPETIRVSSPTSTQLRPIRLDYSSNFEKRRFNTKKNCTSTSKENANGFSRQFIDDGDFY